MDEDKIFVKNVDKDELELRKTLDPKTVRKKTNYKKNIRLLLIFLFLIVFGLVIIMLRDRVSIGKNKYPEVFYPLERISDLEQLDSSTRKKAIDFLELANLEGLNPIIIETYRTQERQDMLFAQGRIEGGNIVTWTENSMHTKRKAFDIINGDGEEPYSDDEFFRRCAEIGEEIGLKSGYYWKNQDKGHFENRGIF